MSCKSRSMCMSYHYIWSLDLVLELHSLSRVTDDLVSNCKSAIDTLSRVVTTDLYAKRPLVSGGWR